MAIPAFTNYNYKNSNYRASTGEINGITVSGGDTTIEWRDSNGTLVDTYVGAGPYTVSDLKKGTYEGTATNIDGSVTTSVTIEDKERLYLSTTTTTTETDCQGTIQITAFKHNGLGLEYELTNIETSSVQTYTGGSGETHTFSGLCNGAYRLVATETQEYQYDMSGTPTLVTSTSSFTYETYINTTVGTSGICDSSPSQFVGEDVFEAMGSTTESFLEFYTGENGPIDGLFDISNVIIKAPKISPNDGTDPTDCSRASLKINIKRIGTTDGNSCDYVSFKLDANGKILFTHSDNTEDYNITSECCSSLGYTPELSEFGTYHCRWKALITDPCLAYIKTENTGNDGYVIFVNGDTGQYTNTVPTAECCTAEGLVATQNTNGYSCSVGVSIPVCEEYTFSGTFAQSTNPEERYALFIYQGGTTNSVPTTECCDANGLESTNLNGNIRCFEAVPDCSGYVIVKTDTNGNIVFRNSDGQLVTEVYDSECCSENGFTYELAPGSTTLYNCKAVEEEIDLPILEFVEEEVRENCTDLHMRIIGIPNTWVKFRVTLNEYASQGYSNDLINKDTGESLTPVIPAGGVGSYCEGSVFVGESGVVELVMTTCVNPPLRDMFDSCTQLEFLIFNYDNTTIKPQNHLYNRACYSMNL